MNITPTNKLLRSLRERGIQWPEVEADLLEPESMTPIRGYPSRQRISGCGWQGYVEPDRNGEPNSWVLIGVRARERADSCYLNPIVGIESRVPLPRYRGGAGQRWPTTREEIIERLREQGYGIEQTKTHVGVYDDGRRVATIAKSASDWRAIRNLCLTLQRNGIDVRRRNP